MMEVQEALNYLVLEYQTNHDFRWGLFTVGGVVLNAVLMLCVGRFGKSKPIAVDVLKSYEKPKVGYLGAEEVNKLIQEIQNFPSADDHQASSMFATATSEPSLSDERKAYLLNMTESEFKTESSNGTLSFADKDYLMERKKLIPTPKIATGVPPAPTPIEAPKPFSDLTKKLLQLPCVAWGHEWKRQLLGTKERVDEYLAYQSGTLLAGFIQAYRDPDEFANLHNFVFAEGEVLVEKGKKDFTAEEWKALSDKFCETRKKVIVLTKQREEREAEEVVFKVLHNRLNVYPTHQLADELKKRQQKST